MEKLAKYMSKPVFVEAVRYQEGMEHGFSSLIRKGNIEPRAPYLITSKGRINFGEDAYIVTNEDGERFPVEAIMFNKLYEKVD